MKAYNNHFRFKDLYNFKGFKFFDSFVDNDSILVVLKRTSKAGICPCCGRRCRYVHKRRNRRLRDLDVAASKVYVSFTQYDLSCKCGYDGVESLNFVDDYSRYSKRFEEKVIILCTMMCIKDVAKEMRIGWEAETKFPVIALQ